MFSAVRVGLQGQQELVGIDILQLQHELVRRAFGCHDQAGDSIVAVEPALGERPGTGSREGVSSGSVPTLQLLPLLHLLLLLLLLLLLPVLVQPLRLGSLAREPRG